MPGNHGFRLDHDQGLGPAGPQSAEHNPEQPIKAIQLRARLLALKHGKLLAKGSGFQSEIVTRQKEGAEVGDHRTGKSEHLLNIYPILVDGVSRQNAPGVQPFDLLAYALLMTKRATKGDALPKSVCRLLPSY